MAITHVEQVLTAAGLPADQFKALNDLPADAKDFTPDAYVAPIRTAVETTVKNDPKFYEGINKDSIPKEFLKTIESEQYGRLADQVRTKTLQGLNLTKEDFKDLGDEFKKLDIFVPAVLKKITDGKVTDKELQAALMKANEEITRRDAEAPTLQKKYQDEAAQTVNDRTFELVALSTLAQEPDLSAPAADLAPALISKLRAKYDFQVDGMNIIPLQKGKTLRAMNAANTKELTWAEAVADVVTSSNWKTKKAATTTTSGTQTLETDGTTGTLQVSSHITPKMQKLIDSQQATG
jgi:hypothetical protein